MAGEALPTWKKGAIRYMNKRLSRWLYRKAAEAIGQEELESLKKDLIEPVKIAARDAVADMLKEKEEEE